MIRHPNNSGLQMDQLTRYYIPAHFIQGLTVSQGNQLILSMQGGISIAEDPNFRFAFDARTGRILWHDELPENSITGVPVSFTIDGAQYLAVPSGGVVVAYRLP